MIFSFPLYSLVFLLCGMVMLGLAVVIWSRRPAPGVVPLTIFLTAGAIIPITAAFEPAFADLSNKILWLKISGLGIESAGVAWLAFSLDYTGSSWWKRPRNLILISLEPVITLILGWTNEFHGWMWSDLYLTNGATRATLICEYGPWFFIDAIYQYSLFLAGIVILARFGIQKSRIYRKQVIILLAGTIIPIFGNILSVLGINLIYGFKLTPIALVFSSIIFSITILQFHLMDVVPVAYKALVNNMPDGILVLDLKGNIIDMNPAIERMIQKNKLIVQGKRLAEVWPVLDKAISSTFFQQHEKISVNYDGSDRTLSISMVILKDKKERTTGKLIALRDITEFKKAQQSLEKLYAKEKELSNSLEEEIQKRSQYSRSLVHELRTPLTAIIASSDLLETVVKEPIASALVQNIRRASSNLEQRVSELFELARGEVGTLKINPEPVDVNNLIQEIIEEMKPVASGKNTTLTSELSINNSQLMGDKSRLRQVLLNLLSNALKFTQEGKILIRAHDYDADSIQIDVQDSGRGMDTLQMKYLFDPYKRVNKDGGSASGLGIGLALSKIFVELHHGKIWAESAPGKGTTISFTIPYVKSEANVKAIAEKKQ